MDEVLKNFENVDDSSMPSWAKALMDGIKVIITEIAFIKDLNTRLDDIERATHENQVNSEKLLEENHRLRVRLEDLEGKFDELENKVDDQEQRNRNYCLMLHGCPENLGENTNEVVVQVLKDKLEIEGFSSLNITRSHRTGVRQGTGRNLRSSQGKTKTRPIIFRLNNWSDRRNIFSNKKKLKGTGLSITENLTKTRMHLLNVAERKYGKGKVWTIEGRVMTKIDDSYVTINSIADLRDLQEAEETE